MYESPIRLLVQQLETSIREQQEKQIFEAVQKCGVDVDREELIKALAYDRAQYAQGYSDGRADAQRWISVEERLPENCEFVLCIVRYGEDAWNYELGFVLNNKWVHPGRSDGTVTHWMPLPQPPEMKEVTP